MMWCLGQVEQVGRCHRISTAFRAHRLQVSITCRMSDVEISLAKMAIRISFGSLFIGGRHSSSVTCMSCRLGTPSDDCESFAPRKKSDSSLSAGAGELVDEVDRESSCARRPASTSTSPSSRNPRASRSSAMISKEARCLMVGVLEVAVRRRGGER